MPRVTGILLIIPSIELPVYGSGIQVIASRLIQIEESQTYVNEVNIMKNFYMRIIVRTFLSKNFFICLEWIS